MERDAVVRLVLAKRQPRYVNPVLARPPAFLSATFRAELLDVHPRSNGDVRVTLNCPYEDRHLVFGLTDAWGANLVVNVTRGEDYTDAISREPEGQDREAGGGRRVVDLTHRRTRTGHRPLLGEPDGGPTPDGE